VQKSPIFLCKRALYSSAKEHYIVMQNRATLIRAPMQYWNYKSSMRFTHTRARTHARKCTYMYIYIYIRKYTLYVCIYMYIYIYIYIYIQTHICMYNIESVELYVLQSFIYVQSSISIERTPPPRGGFPIDYVPWSRTRRKRTPLNFFETGALRGVLFLRVLDQGT